MKRVLRIEAMSILLIASLAGAGILPGLAGAQQQLVGTTTVMSAGSGDEVGPRVDCNLASYTNDTGGLSEVRYFDFTANANRTIPTAGLAFLSDVSRTRVAYTNVTGAGSQIGVFDTATSSTTIVPGGNQRTNPSIGGNLVAFEDRSFSTSPSESEIVLHDLSTGITTRLTTDTFMDVNPAVSRNGDVVVWQKCQTTGLGCHVYVATQAAPGVFVTTQLTGPPGEESDFRAVATNGTVVAYRSVRGGEADIFYQPISGGTEMRIALPGDQRNPTIAGNLIAFESIAVASPLGDQYDLFVYDMGSGTVFRATDTPVWYSDITACNGIARIVYSAVGTNGDFNVFAFTFTPPAATARFGSFTAAVAFARGPRAHDDELRVGGVFTLGSDSNGITPLTEEVALQVGTFTVTIPIGALRRDRFGLLRFDGPIDGHHVQIVLTPLGHGRYAFAAEAEGLDLPGTRTPVGVTLRIGNDAGSVTVTPFIN